MNCLLSFLNSTIELEGEIGRIEIPQFRTDTGTARVYEGIPT